MTLTFGPPASGWDYKGKGTPKYKVYVAGPMRGYDLYNFPAFDKAASQLRDRGWSVINPAELDREIGINEDTTDLPPGFIYDALRRDFAAICTVEGIVFLPGWYDSSGARAEARVGLDIGLDFWEIGPRGGLEKRTRAYVAVKAGFRLV